MVEFISIGPMGMIEFQKTREQVVAFNSQRQGESNYPNGPQIQNVNQGTLTMVFLEVTQMAVCLQRKVKGW